MIQRRFKELPWFHKQPSNILLAGVGGVGSWVALSLGRADNKFMYMDDDTITIENIGGQFYQTNQVDFKKCIALDDNITMFGTNSENFSYTNLKLDYDIINSITEELTIFSCVDDMEIRKLLFQRFCNLTKGNSIFLDARMSAEMFEVFCVTNDLRTQEKYAQSLFNNEDIPDDVCTQKATTHNGMMCANTMIAIYNNFVTNHGSEIILRNVPYHIDVKLDIFKYTVEYVEEIRNI